MRLTTYTSSCSRPVSPSSSYHPSDFHPLPPIITNMAAPTLPPYASSPFDNTLDGDLILRSSDRIDFRVVPAILRLASPFFASMLEVGQSLPSASDGAQADGDEIRDGCRVVPVSEDSATLDTLLRIIYPQEYPSLDDFKKLAHVLAASLKYDMAKATVLTSTKLCGFVAQNPVRVWAVAVRNRLEVEARLAAAEICRQAIVVLDVFPEEMRDISSGAYYRLLQYRRLGGAVGGAFKFCEPEIPSIPHGPAPLVETPSSSAIEPSLPASFRPHFRSLADVVCRSSDGREFPAHKALLMLASPTVLAPLIVGMPASADPASEEAGASPVLSFDENGETLQVLLSLCHSDQFDTSIDVQKLFLVPKIRHALSKYDMRDALEVLRGQWSTLMGQDPLRAYLLASRCEDREEARKAARLLLSKTTIQDYYTAYLEVTPASFYRNTCLYHRSCWNAASEVGTLFQSYVCNGGVAPGRPLVPTRSSSCRTASTWCYGIRPVVQNQVADNVCLHCTMYARVIISGIAMLSPPSGPLLDTLDILRGSPNASAVQWLSSPEDQLSIQAVYTHLYDEVTAKINEVCRSPRLAVVSAADYHRIVLS